MIDLSKVILIAIGSNKINETKKAIDICLSKCWFKDVIYFTHDANTSPYAKKIDEIKSIKDYDKFVLHQLPVFIDKLADYYLTIHWDGFIVNDKAWTDEFFNYDYIGAPWPWYEYKCGNGGFCLKSQKFISTQIDNIDLINIDYPDDVSLCVDSRHIFIKNGCKFAPPNISLKFSVECGNYAIHKSFGFHDFQYHKQFMDLIQ